MILSDGIAFTTSAFILLFQSCKEVQFSLLSQASVSKEEANT
jgi:hypothetical protein